jgi:RNA polymerase sigma-70 factor, ECF subfamily
MRSEGQTDCAGRNSFAPPVLAFGLVGGYKRRVAVYPVLAGPRDSGAEETMSVSQVDVSSLIAAARGQQPGALDDLLSLYRQYVRLLAEMSMHKALRAKANASDAVQETMLLAHQHFDQFEGKSEAELAAWLRRILARQIAGLARHFWTAARHSGRELSIDEVLDASSMALGKLLVDDSPSPSNVCQQRELAVVVADALAQLSDDHREVIVLRNIVELDWSGVAERMDRSVDAARFLWTRALKQLRPLLEGSGVTAGL